MGGLHFIVGSVASVVCTLWLIYSKLSEYRDGRQCSLYTFRIWLCLLTCAMCNIVKFDISKEICDFP